MTTAAGEHDWMAGLDWSMHGNKGRRFANPRQFLAVTLHRIAEYATGVWPEHEEIPFFLAKAGIEPRGAFRPADEVFTADGSPTTNYGDGLASAIAHAARRGIPLASSNAVTHDEWEWIEWHGAWDWSCGEGARLVWSRLAPAFAELASSGRVETWIEPIDGGRAERLPASAWQLPPDAAVRRCARCAVNGDDPFARNAPATHHVFVDGAGLDKAIMETAFGTYMARLEPDIELPRLIDAADAPALVVRTYLRSLIVGSEAVLSYDDMRDLIEARFGRRPGEREMRKLRDAVLRDHSDLRERYSRTGPRPRHPVD